RSASTARGSRRRASSRPAAGAISPPRCSPSPRHALASTSRTRCARARSCGAFSTTCSPGSSTRWRRFVRSWSRCSELATATAPTLAEIEAARERLAGRARVTPVHGSETLSRIAGTKVWLKAENLQRTGSFKIRGAVNKLSSLTEEERAAGVVAASAGNHGQAVARAARDFGVRATIFMPQDAPMAKVEPCISYGGEAVLRGEALEDAFEEAYRFADETGATFVHAYE